MSNSTPPPPPNIISYLFSNLKRIIITKTFLPSVRNQENYTLCMFDYSKV